MNHNDEETKKVRKKEGGQDMKNERKGEEERVGGKGDRARRAKRNETSEDSPETEAGET